MLVSLRAFVFLFGVGPSVFGVLVVLFVGGGAWLWPFCLGFAFLLVLSCIVVSLDSFGSSSPLVSRSTFSYIEKKK